MQRRLTLTSAPLASLFLILAAFAVVCAGMSKGLNVMIASAEEKRGSRECYNYVVDVLKDGSIRFGGERLQKGQLRGRLAEWSKPKNEPMLFIVVEPGISFQEAAEVIDVARGAAKYVVLVPPSVERELRTPSHSGCLQSPPIPGLLGEQRLRPTFDLREVPPWPW
jgi:biopolymer transport protein ExbD